ncbi:MAG: dihydrofolate reductase family protein [Candidatus Nanopelagicus sp.]
MKPLIVTANLIVGQDGSTTLNGSSTALSTEADRLRFHQLRDHQELIIIGGNTARREPYKRTPIPLYILTHAKVRLQPKNQLAKQFQLTPAQLLTEISNNFQSQTSPINVLVEAGPKLLMQMIEQTLIDLLYLTINLRKQGKNQISIGELVKNFELLESEVIEDCEFRKYKKLAH